MENFKLQDLQKEEFKILLEIDRICKKHNIKYFAFNPKEIISYEEETVVDNVETVEEVVEAPPVTEATEEINKETPEESK